MSTGRRTRATELQAALLQLHKGGPEEQAVAAGEIDAVIDYSRNNVILFPAARLALRARGRRITAAKRGAVANSVLSALPRAEHRRLLAGLEPVALKFGQVLYEPERPVLHVYFPIDSVVCLMTTAEELQALGTGLVGCEGMVGIALALDTEVSSDRALVIATGTALRMEARGFQEALRQSPVLQRELHRYAYAKLALARNAVGCNCFHAARARLARWLLMISDRVRSPAFFSTQEFLADVLGVRRCTITETAGHLQRRQLISYSRGNIRILDRSGLEGVSCACYRRIETLYTSASRYKPQCAQRFSG
jgi:CRP-like cAMP-binding protein